MPKQKQTPASNQCAQCDAEAMAQAAAKTANTAKRAAERAFIKAREATERAKAARNRRNSPPVKTLCFLAIVLCGALLWSIGTLEIHVAKIETSSGQTIEAAMASESDCIAFTRALGPDVASANCYTVKD